MKLKVRLPLLFTVIGLSLALVIAVYIKSFVIGGVIQNIIEAREQLLTRDQSIPVKAGELYPDMPSIERYLEETAHSQDLEIALYDTRFQPVARFNPDPEENGPVERWHQIKNKEGTTVLLLTVQHPLTPQDIGLKSVFTKTFLFLIIALALLFVILNVYLHYYVTKPIQGLNKRLGKIKYAHFPEPLANSRKDEIGELYEHVKEMEERLRQANKEQIDMIAAITHDIKTPLTSINGFIELLLSKNALSEQDKQDYLRLIGKKANHLTELIGEFSAYTKNEALLPSITLQAVHAKRFFENVAAEYEAELAGLDFQFHSEHSFGDAYKILIHEPMLRRVFANLISNAVRYGSKEDLEVYMRGYIENDRAVFVIEDNGVGVPAKDISSLFQRFFTVDASRQSKEGGTGLGLAGCKSIVERHGGEIAAFSSPMGGLGIRFDLPLMRE